MLTNVPVHAKAPASSAIIGDSGLVDGYLDYPKGTRSVKTLARLWFQIRRFRPQVLVYLTKPRGEKVVLRDQRFFRACGISKIVGLPLGDRAINLQVNETLWESEAARLARCVSELGAIDLNEPAAWDLRLTAAELGRAEAALQPTGGQPFIACGPGTKVQAKDWGTENWCALMAELSRKFPGHSLVLVGAKEDREVSELLAARWQGKTVTFAASLHRGKRRLYCAKQSCFSDPTAVRCILRLRRGCLA